MTRKMHGKIPDLLADPFAERRAVIRERMQLLGGRFQFESNNHELMRMVKSAYADLPRHRLSAAIPHLTVRLLLRPGGRLHSRRRPEPPPLDMVSGAGFLGGVTDSGDFVIVSPQQRAALVVVTARMLKFPYHTRYELIEFAVFTLAARAQGLVSLHAACVGQGGGGLLLMGPSGAGKSTVALQCLLHGLDFLAEDAVFVAPDTLIATGAANFLHVRADSLRWIESVRSKAAIRNSPMIRRRSGVTKYELDLRLGDYRLDASPLRINAVVFLSPTNAGDGPLLRPMTKSGLLTKLTQAQAYAANQPEWRTFSKRVSRLDAFELRRGRHPLEAVEVLRELLGRRTR
jgi:hypothetical protein